MTSLHNIAETDITWDNMTYAEKNHQLYLKQKELLDQFLKRGAITQKQHDKSLHDLSVKMGKKYECCTLDSAYTSLSGR